jgi:hypothetical protein
MQERKETPRYDQLCLKLPIDESLKRVKAGEKHVIRMVIPENEKISWNDLVRGKVEFDSRVIDHQVILKTDGFPTYHLAVVIDDHAMNTPCDARRRMDKSVQKHFYCIDTFDGIARICPYATSEIQITKRAKKNDVSIFHIKKGLSSSFS